MKEAAPAVALAARERGPALVQGAKAPAPAMVVVKNLALAAAMAVGRPIPQCFP